MQKARVQSLGREDTLENGMATHSSFLARRLASFLAWTEETGGLHGVAKRHD